MFLVMYVATIFIASFLVLELNTLSIIFYGIINFIYSIFVIFLVLFFITKKTKVMEYSHLTYIYNQNPILYVLFTLFSANLIGIPPLPGFISKYILLDSMLRHNWRLIPLIMVVTFLMMIIGFVRIQFHFIGNNKNTNMFTEKKDYYLLLLCLPLLYLNTATDYVLIETQKILMNSFW